MDNRKFIEVHFIKFNKPEKNVEINNFKTV